MKTFVINLEKDTHRRTAIIDECARWDIIPEIIQAILGANLSDKDINNFVDTKAKQVFTLGEIGCAISHYNIYKKIVSEHIPYAFILEDDVGFTKDPRPILEAVTQLVKPNDPKCFLLSKYYTCLHKNPISYRDIVFYPAIDAVGAYAYIVTQAFAERFIKYNTPIKATADLWKYFIRIQKFNIYVTPQEYIDYNKVSDTNQSNLESERKIRLKGPDRKKYEKKLKSGSVFNKIHYFFFKLIYGRYFRSIKD